MTRFDVLLCAWILLLPLVACGDKKDEASAAPAPAPAPAPPPAPAQTPTPESDLDAQSLELMGKVADIMEAHRASCDKMGAELKAYLEANKDLVERLTEWASRQTAEQKKAFEEKHAARRDDILRKIGPAADACSTNEEVMIAIARLPS